MCVEVEGNRLGQYVKNHIESLIFAVTNSNTIPSENSILPKESKNQNDEKR